MDYDHIVENFVGKDKIQAIRIENLKNGTFTLKYKEGKKNE